MFKTSGPDFKKIKLEAQKLIGQGKYQEALNKLIELSKQISDPEVYNSIGDLYIRFQNNEQALQYLEKAYKIYREQDFREIAISVAKKILRIEKDRHDIYIDLVEMEMENGNVDKALDWALEFVKLPNPDPSYVGKLFRLLNDIANEIQENTEQATKFERLLIKLQELAEQLSLATLESGIEIADAKEFFDKGDFEEYGGFFDAGHPAEEAKIKKTTRKKEEQEPVEKIEFFEQEEEEKSFITASGFSNFLEVEKSDNIEKTVLEEKPTSSHKSEESVKFEISEKTEFVEETEEKLDLLPPESKSVSDKRPPSEQFKTVLEEELPEEIEAEQKVWESLTSKKITEQKPVPEVTSSKESSAEEEEPEKLRVAFDEYVKLKEEEKKVTFDEVVSEKFKSESKEEPKLEQKPTEGGVLEKVVKESTTEKFSKEFKSSVFQEKEAAPAVVQKPREFSEAMSDLLKIIRDFKEDLVGLETWPYSSDSPFEVAKEYYEMKLYQPAVEEFQKLLGDPRYRLQSMTYLGKIFYERGELDFAEAILRKAIEEAGYMEKESIEAYYYLALTLEALKRFMEAKELYLRVYIFDSSFRDVAAKVMTLRSKAL